MRAVAGSDRSAGPKGKSNSSDAFTDQLGRAGGEGGAKRAAAFALCSPRYCAAATGVDPKPTPGALKTVTVLGTSSTAAKLNEAETAMPKAPP